MWISNTSIFWLYHRSDNINLRCWRNVLSGPVQEHMRILIFASHCTESLKTAWWLARFLLSGDLWSLGSRSGHYKGNWMTGCHPDCPATPWTRAVREASLWWWPSSQQEDKTAATTAAATEHKTAKALKWNQLSQCSNRFFLQSFFFF